MGSNDKQTGVCERVHGYDALRGLAVVSMVLFHLCYDLAYLYGVELSWFGSPLQDIWRASISWTFLLIAGIMCNYSSNNLKRAGRYLIVALIIYIVTSIAAVDTPISYGIIYCMGESTLVAWVLRRVGLGRHPGKWCLLVGAILAALFLVCLGVPTGTFGLKAFGGPYVTVPSWPYKSGILSWLGFPGPHFASGDYYTPIPFTLLFLAGMMLGRAFEALGTPKKLKYMKSAPLEFIGRHALEIYILHQPLVLGVLMLAFGR